jgi:hypothetical protein
MSRRTSLPGAAELFRTTSPSPSGPVSDSTDAFGFPEPAVRAVPDPIEEPEESAPVIAAVPRGVEAEPAPERTRPVAKATVRRRRPAERRPSGREKHDEKITVYVSPDELFDIESARLTLRGDHGLAIDRGRIVREAIAIVLADLDTKGEDSILVRRLRGL